MVANLCEDSKGLSKTKVRIITVKVCQRKGFDQTWHLQHICFCLSFNIQFDGMQADLVNIMPGQPDVACPVSNAWQSCGTTSKAQCDSLNHVTDILGSTSLNIQYFLEQTKKAITMLTFKFYGLERHR